MSLTERVENWRARGRAESFRGRSIHVMARPGEGPLVVMLHGFPTSSYDWRRLIAELGGERILAFDFLGFGLSEKPRDHNYTLAWQADLTEELVDRHGDGRPALICAHDMGASVATELMARELAGELGFGIAAVLMTNGSILLERSNPTFAQKVLRSRVGPVAARITSEAFFKRQFGSIFSERHPLSPARLRAGWQRSCGR